MPAQERSLGRTETVIYESLVEGIEAMNDPRVKDVLFYVDHVCLNKSDKKAVCYLSLLEQEGRRMDDSSKKQFVSALNKATGFLKTFIHRNAVIRVVPQLKFKLSTGEHGDIS